MGVEEQSPVFEASCPWVALSVALFPVQAPAHFWARRRLMKELGIFWQAVFALQVLQLCICYSMCVHFGFTCPTEGDPFARLQLQQQTRSRPQLRPLQDLISTTFSL